jgi:hypothetical protein
LKCQRLGTVMTKLLAGLQSQSVSRVAAYAAIAALITGALFAADGAYRWYGAESAQVAAPSPQERSIEASQPAPVEATAVASPAQGPAAAPAEAAEIEQRSEERSVTAQTPNAPVPSPPGPEGQSVAGPAIATAPGNSIPDTVTGMDPQATTRSADTAPRVTQPPLPPERPELLTPPARQATGTPPARQAVRERATPRRPVQAAEKPRPRAEKRAQKPAEQPNVYWERDSGSQLGFAPQLRKRTCDPATGQMPMQCYYPREGRERFPAKPVN